jgi:hypothetical protein
VLHHGAQDRIDRFGGRGGNLPGYGRDESLHVGPGYGSHAPVAETTRKGALSLGTEADHAEIKAWAHEILAWIDLTSGNYHGVVAAARTGIEAAPHHSVAIQLSAQEAKAWARIGDRRATEVALDKGRRLLEAMPYPDNLDHHFVVDPTKFDFYSMDCYRHLAEVIQASTDFDGTERAPCDSPKRASRSES